MRWLLKNEGWDGVPVGFGGTPVSPQQNDGGWTGRLRNPPIENILRAEI
jgi:hypothetical protein